MNEKFQLARHGKCGVLPTVTVTVPRNICTECARAHLMKLTFSLTSLILRKLGRRTSLCQECQSHIEYNIYGPKCNEKCDRVKQILRVFHL